MPQKQGQPQKERKPGKGKATAGVQARRLIRNAKQAANDGEPTPKAEFLMQEANVMATLELAEAIRGQQEQE
jgi:hypothetical protein